MRTVWTVLALLSTTFVLSANAQVASQPFDSAQITKKVSPGVVLIKGTTSSGELLGTGFIISSDGKIATNLHVVEGLKNGGVQLASGEKFDSFTVLAFDARKDIAIIKIPGFDLPTVALGNSNNVEVGEQVLAVGSPLGLQGTVTTGVVSAMRDDPTGGGFKVLQTDASVNPGNSGGPLINRQAEVIAIVTFKIRGGENLAARVLTQILPSVPIILFTTHIAILPVAALAGAGIKAVVSKMDSLDILADHALRLLALDNAPIQVLE